MSKRVIRVLLLAGSLAAVGILFAVIFQNQYVPAVLQDIEDTRDEISYSQYVDAIHYGTLDIRKRLKAEIQMSRENTMTIPSGAMLLPSVGEVEKGAPLYRLDGNTICAEEGIRILSSEKLDSGGFSVMYRPLEEDAVCFYCSAADANGVCAGDSVSMSNNLGTLTVDRIEKNGDNAVIYSQKGNYEAYLAYDLFGDFRLRREQEVYYIENEVLTKPIGTDRYQLDIYNPYATTDIFFYTKEITVLPFNEWYSIVLSGNVREYERVLLDEPKY